MALPLVQFHDNGSCAACPEALEWLRTLRDPVAVVAVAGRYRTGKSFLLNHVLLRRTQGDNTNTGMNDDSHGFPVGPTTQPCTKGLWLWPRAAHTATLPDGRPCHVLVIDTEGTGATNSNDTRDTRIFALALLLSSYFIYNSQGSIDEPALSNLQVVTEVSRLVRMQAERKEAPQTAPWNAGSSSSASDADDEDWSDIFPTFMWVVRDFVLELRSEDGRLLEERDYLEEALRCNRGGAAKDDIRQAILKAFPTRDCATLVRPCNDESKLRHLNNMPEEDLRPEFVEQARKLRAKAMAAAPKTVRGHVVTGAMLAALCECYSQAIAQGGAPVIETAWTYVCQDQCRRARKEAFEIYRSFRPAGPTSLPLQLELELQAKQAEALAHFDKKAVGDDMDDVRQDLALQLDTDVRRRVEQALEAWEARCQTAWTPKTDEGSVQDLIEQWVEDVRPTAAERAAQSACAAAYLHASRMFSTRRALAAAAARRARGAEEEAHRATAERSEALAQLLAAQEQHRTEAQELRAAADENEAACNALRDQLEQQLQAARQGLQAARQEAEDALCAERKASEDALARFKQQFEEKAEERQRRWQELTVQREATQKEYDVMKDAQEEAIREKDALAQQLEAQRSRAEEAAVAQQKCQELEQTVQGLEKELESAAHKQKADAEKATQEIQELSDTWGARQAQAEQAARQVQAQLRQEAEYAAEELQKERQKLEDAAQALRGAKEAARAERAEAARKLEAARAEATRRQNTFEQELLQLQSQHASAAHRAHQERQEAEKAGMAREMELRDAVQELKAQHGILQVQNKEMEGRMSEIRTNLKRKSHQIETLHGEKSKISEIKHQLKYTRTVYDQIHKQHQALREERNAVVAQLDATRRESMVEHNKLEIRCGTQMEKVRELIASNKHLQGQLDKQTQEVQRLKKVFDSIKS